MFEIRYGIHCAEHTYMPYTYASWLLELKRNELMTNKYVYIFNMRHVS